MQKRLLAALLSLILLTACAYADGADERPYYTIRTLGFKVYVNDSWVGAARSGRIQLDVQCDYDDDALTRGRLFILPDNNVVLIDDESLLYETDGALVVITVAGDAAEPYDDLSGFDAQEICEYSGYTYTAYLNAAPEALGMDDELLPQAQAMLAQFRDEADTTIVIETAPLNESDLNPSIKEFDTVDINGEPADISILANAPYTLVDIWGTYCGPCIQEMPELAKLAEEYEGRVQFLGVVCDISGADDADTIQAALDIVNNAGVKYRSLIPDASLLNNLMRDVQYIPTKYIVDSDGKYVAGPIIGAQGADAIRRALDEVVG